MAQFYLDLDIPQIAHRLGVEVHLFSLRLPRFEQYESASQRRRSAKSVSANIVEGCGRRSYKADFVKFLVYASASRSETIEWLTYICDCHKNSRDEAQILLDQSNELRRKLNRFIQTVMASHRSAE